MNSPQRSPLFSQIATQGRELLPNATVGRSRECREGQIRYTSEDKALRLMLGKNIIMWKIVNYGLYYQKKKKKSVKLGTGHS